MRRPFETTPIIPPTVQTDEAIATGVDVVSDARNIGPVEWRKTQKELQPLLEKLRNADDGSAEHRMLGYGFWTKASQELTKRYGIPACGGLLLNAFWQKFLHPKKDFARASDEEYRAFLTSFFHEAVSLLDDAKAKKAEQRQGPLVDTLRKSYNALHQPFGIDTIPRNQARHERAPNQRRAHLERILLDPPSKREVIDWLRSENTEMLSLQAAYRELRQRLAVQEAELHHPEGEAMFIELLGKNWKTALVDLIPKAFRHIPRRIEVHHHETLERGEDPDDVADTLGVWHRVPSKHQFAQKHRGRRNSMMHLYTGNHNARTNLVNTFLHELAHGISNEPDRDHEQHRANRIFLEEVIDEPPRYSSYVAKSYRKNSKLGLSEDFSESFARYFTDHVQLLARQPKRYLAIDRIVHNVYSVTETEIVRLRELESRSIKAFMKTHAESFGDGPSLKAALKSMPLERVWDSFQRHFSTHTYSPLKFALFDSKKAQADASSELRFNVDDEGRLLSVAMASANGVLIPLLKNATHDDEKRLTSFETDGKSFDITYGGSDRIPIRAMFRDAARVQDDDGLDPAIPDGIIRYTKNEDGSISERCQMRVLNRDTFTRYRFDADGSPKNATLFYFNERVASETFPSAQEVTDPAIPYRSSIITIDPEATDKRRILIRSKKVIPWKMPA